MCSIASHFCGNIFSDLHKLNYSFHLCYHWQLELQFIRFAWIKNTLHWWAACTCSSDRHDSWAWLVRVQFWRALIKLNTIETPTHSRQFRSSGYFPFHLFIRDVIADVFRSVFTALSRHRSLLPQPLAVAAACWLPFILSLWVCFNFLCLTENSE